MDLVFASGNEHKFEEAKEILDSLGVSLRFRRCRLEELQTVDIDRLIKKKCMDAYGIVGRPTFVEHTILENISFGGFPGGLTSPFLATVGLSGAVQLLGRTGSNQAKATTIIAYTDGFTVKTFLGSIQGTISSTPGTTDTDWKKFGWNAIFIPDGYTITLAEIGQAEKNTFSMRKIALERMLGGITP